MPTRQNLLGLWLALSGICVFGGFLLGWWLDQELGPQGGVRWALWIVAFSPGLLLLLMGLPLEIKLFGPLRHLQVQLARFAANPDGHDDYPAEGWLQPLQPDLNRLREGWQQDRRAVATAHSQGAADAARIRHELESVLSVLQLPLLLCDKHRRLLMFNPAAEQLFAHNPALGLGRRLEELLPAPSLANALGLLPADGSPRELVLPHAERWLRCDLRRVLANQGEALLMLQDVTAQLAADQEWRQPLAELLPELRRRTANLTAAGEILASDGVDAPLRQRFETAVAEDSAALSGLVDQLGMLLETMAKGHGELADTWSNDLLQVLTERVAGNGIELVAVGIPAWLKADGPGLLDLLHRLVVLLVADTGQQQIDAEIQIGNRRVYLDLVWRGKPILYETLECWRAERLADSPIAPTLGDVLRRHDSDWWCLTDDDGLHARLRLPLAAAERVGAPTAPRQSRPEFHDFSIADLPAPSTALGECPLRQLELVVFDTETTGLDLRGADAVISIAGCRILNGRLLARDVFDQRVFPERAIPPDSTRIHGLTDTDVANAPPIPVVLPRFREFVGHGVLVAHNAAFDLLAVSQHAPSVGVSFDMPVLDTLLLSRALDPTLEGHGLDALAERFQLIFPPGTRHTALGDARVTAELLLALLPRMEARGVTTLAQAMELQRRALQVSV